MCKIIQAQLIKKGKEKRTKQVHIDCKMNTQTIIAAVASILQTRMSKITKQARIGNRANSNRLNTNSNTRIHHQK